VKNVATSEKTVHRHPRVCDKTLVRLLSTHPFTASMSEAMVEKLAGVATAVEFDADEVLFHAGDLSHRFGLLVTGSASLELSGNFFSMTIQILNAGDAFGWSALLDDTPALFQIRARERAQAICFDAKGLNRLCKRDRRLAAEVYSRLIHVLNKRVRALEARLGEFAGSSDRREDRVRPPATPRDEGLPGPVNPEFTPTDF